VRCGGAEWKLEKQGSGTGRTRDNATIDFDVAETVTREVSELKLKEAIRERAAENRCPTLRGGFVVDCFGSGFAVKPRFDDFIPKAEGRVIEADLAVVRKNVSAFNRECVRILESPRHFQGNDKAMLNPLDRDHLSR
jgi:hypothetical protein